MTFSTLWDIAQQGKEKQHGPKGNRSNDTLTYGIVGVVGSLIILAGFIALFIFCKKQSIAKEAEAIQMQGKHFPNWLPETQNTSLAK